MPSSQNPYIAQSCRCYGYDVLDLAGKCSFPEVVYLLFRGELPSSQEAELLEKLMIAFINPGPRNPASRAAMLAGVSKAAPSALLPIALNIFSGNHMGSGNVEMTVRFFRRNHKISPDKIIDGYTDLNKKKTELVWEPIPGFGRRFGGIDEYIEKTASMIGELSGSGKVFEWASAVAEKLHEFNMGWLATGVASAVLSDLGFHPKAAAGIYQLIAAPGLLAHGLETLGKPLTAMPFVPDEDYIIER